MAENAYNISLRLIAEEHLSEALHRQSKWLSKLADGNLSDRFEALLADDRRLVDDFLAGNPDPSRAEVVRSLKARAYLLVDEVYERMRILTNSRREFALLRQVRNNLLTLHTDESDPESILYYFWLTSDVSPVYQRRFEELVQHADIVVAEAAAAGVMLSLFRRFSEERLLMLITLAQATDKQKLCAKVITAIMALCLKYEDRLDIFPVLKKALLFLFGDEDLRKMCLSALWQIAFTLRTDEANDIIQAMQNSVFDAINTQNIKPESPLIIIDDSDDQPEWLRQLSDRIYNSMGAISEMSSSGVDLSFGHLRSARQVKFFTQHEINWFISFTTENKYLDFPADTQVGHKILSMLEQNNLCDSDKYAICVFYQQMQSFANVTDEQWEMIAENASDAASLPSAERNVQYAVRDLYRFFRLNPWNVPDDLREVTDGICRSRLLVLLQPDADYIERLADIYATTSRYQQAIDLYERLIEIEPSAVTYQRIGFAFERLQRFDDALQAYERADIIELDDNWTQWRMVHCLQHLSEHDKAIALLDRLIERNGTKHSYLLARAHSLEQTGKAVEAQQIYFELLFEKEDDLEVMRRLSLNLMLAGKFQQALSYASPVTDSDKSTKEDTLKVAWLLLALGNFTESLGYFRKAVADTGEQLRLFDADAARIPAGLIPAEYITFMREAIALG